MPNTYKVTYQFNLPIRPDITVEIIAENEDEINNNGHVAAEARGVKFGYCNYNDKPSKIELIEG